MAYDEYKHAGADEYKFIQMTDIDEQQPDAVLKGAEYVEYLGLYFNREKEASAAIQHIGGLPGAHGLDLRMRQLRAHGRRPGPHR